MFCRKCGAQIPDDSEFCPKCGTRNVIQNVIEVETSGVNLSKSSVQKNNTPAILKNPTPCPECGKILLTEWEYCPYCIEDNPGFDHSGAENPTNTGLRCPECGKSLLAEWENCPYCTETNPYYKSPKPQNPPAAAPPPMVVVQQPQIVKEEKIIIREEKKPEEKGCGTLIAEAIGGFLTVCFFIGLLGSCFGCSG